MRPKHEQPQNGGDILGTSARDATAGTTLTEDVVQELMTQRGVRLWAKVMATIALALLIILALVVEHRDRIGKALEVANRTIAKQNLTIIAGEARLDALTKEWVKVKSKQLDEQVVRDVLWKVSGKMLIEMDERGLGE